MQSAGNLTWTGDLYATTGPYFGALPFNPAAVVASKVGTMTWSSQFVNSGTVVYSVGGVVVTKNVVRQPLVFDDYNGTYVGALHGTTKGCFNPAGDVTGIVAGTTTVFQNGQSITVLFTSAVTGVTLSLSGALTQGGQFGTVQGTYSDASSGEVGNFTLFEINGQLNYWMARFSLNGINDGCQGTGVFGGVRSP